MLIARLAVLLLALAVLFRRSIPVLAGPFFALLFIAFSIGANAEGRELVLAAATLLIGAVVAVRLDNPPGGWDDIFFALTILTGGPLLVGRLVRACRWSASRERAPLLPADGRHRADRRRAGRRGHRGAHAES